MTGAAPGVSFVVTVYNKYPFLPQVVDGLARQRGEFPREFIFIDDGSTDGSLEELERLTAGWPDTHILHQPNLGPSIATNRGLAAARYPLIKLVDGDDVLLPGAAALLSVLLLRDPAAVLAFGVAEGYSDPAEAATRLDRARAVLPPDPERFEALPDFLRNCDLAPSACMVRTEAVRRVGGCDERVFVQDYSLFLRLAASGPFLRVAAPVVLAAGSPRGHLNDGGPQILHDMNLALFHFLSEHNLPKRLVRLAVRRAQKRAWRWARRRERVPLLDRSLWLLIKSYLPFPQPSPRLVWESRGVFCASRPVRAAAPLAQVPPTQPHSPPAI